jgi:hypothetical protein
MQATRVRYESILEWAVAAAAILGLLALGSLVMREFRSLPAVMPVIAREAHPVSTAIPAGVPSRAVSVPVLLLPDQKEVRVGDSLADIAQRLGREAETGAQSVEQAPNGARVTRFYEYQGTRFVLVFEPFEAKGQPRVAAIFLQ